MFDWLAKKEVHHFQDIGEGALKFLEKKK